MTSYFAAKKNIPQLLLMLLIVKAHGVEMKIFSRPEVVAAVVFN